MSLAFPEIRVGEPIRKVPLSVFPLFTTVQSAAQYVLSCDGMDQGTVKVTEISRAGSVPDLAVENQGDACVLFLEGEQLVGAKQNRILNATILVAGRSKKKIPVSCVEAGRWRYRSRDLSPCLCYAPAMLRAKVKAKVTRSVRARRGHRADQAEVWAEVARQQAALGVSSPSLAMLDTYESHRDKIAEIKESLPYPEGATGLAVALNKHVASLDLFDKPATCARVWDRLISGYAMDALEAESQAELASVADVEQLVNLVQQLAWEQVPTVGEGEEFRAERPDELYGSALVFQGTLVHLSVTVRWPQHGRSVRRGSR